MEAYRVIIFMFLGLLFIGCKDRTLSPQEPLPPPKAITLKSLIIRQIPELDNNGVTWDNDNTGPDIVFKLNNRSGTSLLFKSDTLTDIDFQQIYIYDLNPFVLVEDIGKNYTYYWEIEDIDPLFSVKVDDGYLNLLNRFNHNDNNKTINCTNEI